MTCFIMTLAPSPTPSQILHTLFDIFLGVDQFQLHVKIIECMTVHTSARSKMAQHNHHIYLISLVYAAQVGQFLHM